MKLDDVEKAYEQKGFRGCVGELIVPRCFGRTAQYRIKGSIEHEGFETRIDSMRCMVRRRYLLLALECRSTGN